MQSYEIQRLPNKVTRIKGISGEYMYLVEGQKKAALIDTGVGYGKLDELVHELTALPVEVYLTHGHIDHAGGALYFEQVHVHPKDIEIMNNQVSMPELEVPEVQQKMAADGYDPKKEIAFYPLYDNDVIDLGGRQLEVVALPGHTMGSIAFLDRENRIIFTGDACNKRTFLFLDHSTSLVQYMDTLQKFMKVISFADHIYNGHDEGEVPPECPRNILNCCIDILNGKDDQQPFSFMDMPGLAAKEIVNEVERNDGIYGNIIYNPNHIYPHSPMPFKK